ncbi:MAG TPA: hypothetical protein VJL88_00730 [Nitrospira sp.]|nr:hypothetical protein [Nitrospira sp.]
MIVTTPSLRWLTLACGVALLTSSGCSRWIEMTTPPGAGDERIPQVIAQDEQVPLILDRIRTTRNGSPQNSSAETEQRVLRSLADIGLFSYLTSANTAIPASREKTVRARLLFDEAIDPHAGGAAFKGIVIGASMYLLTPLLPLEYEYGAHLTLELERWDGQVKQYESRSSGMARYHLFGATPIMIDELKGLVTETCLTDLARQIVNDTIFFNANSAPLGEPGIRTVSVKPRTPSTPPVIPVSTVAPTEP